MHQATTPLSSVIRWLPNCLTLSRAVLALLLLYAAANQAWGASFWLLVAAIITDFLDGWAAVYFHAESKFGTIADPIADFILATAAIAGLYLNGYIPLWLGLVMAGLAALIGYVKFLPYAVPLRPKVRPISATYLFAVWISSAWAYGSLAYGWTWLFPAITVLALALGGMFKRHRLVALYSWPLQIWRRR